MTNYAGALYSLILTIGLNQACAQETGSISGTITGPYENTVEYAPIQATNVSTGEKFRSQSARDGSYEFLNLTPGQYTLEVVMQCCAYESYESEEIEVSGATLFNVEIQEGSSFNTIGDDPGVIAMAIKERQIIPDEPPPRLPGGHPDLSGVWLINEDPFPEDADALPWAQKLFDERVANEFRYHPHSYCLPGDPPIPGGAAPFMAKFVHDRELLIILFEDAPGFRQVFLDGREHPEWPNPTWMGHSIGHWEEDVLTIDTVGFNDRGWMNGYPRSEQLHVIERYQRTEYGRLELELIIEDPKVFNRPWRHLMVFDLAPQEELIEYVCENNRWAQPEGE